MNYREHGVPHVHAVYAGSRASIEIRTQRVLAGALPERALRLVAEWAALRGRTPRQLAADGGTTAGGARGTAPVGWGRWTYPSSPASSPSRAIGFG